MLGNNVNLTIFGGQPGNQFRLGCIYVVQATNGDTIKYWAARCDPREGGSQLERVGRSYP